MGTNGSRRNRRGQALAPAVPKGHREQGCHGESPCSHPLLRGNNCCRFAAVGVSNPEVAIA
jgi:hypothetical protein